MIENPIKLAHRYITISTALCNFQYHTTSFLLLLTISAVAGFLTLRDWFDMNSRSSSPRCRTFSRTLIVIAKGDCSLFAKTMGPEAVNRGGPVGTSTS